LEHLLQGLYGVDAPGSQVNKINFCENFAMRKYRKMQCRGI